MRNLSLFSAAPPSQEDGRARILAPLADRKRVCAIGLTLYFLSFFMPAVKAPSDRSALKGYFCAEFALTYPWSEGRSLFSVSSFAAVSLLISGWVNPLFLAATSFRLWRPLSSNGPALGVLTLICIPFCWVIFAYLDFYPREGHIAWLTGMVVTINAGRLAKVAERLVGVGEHRIVH